MATSSTQLPPTITSLAQEIKDMIADNCELADLPTLRLIDRGFDTAGKQTLGKQYMQTRTHIYTLDSLTELEKITADPDLAKHIQKIVLVARKYVEPKEDEPRVDSMEWRNFFDAELPSQLKGSCLLQSIFRNLSRARELHPTSAGHVILAVAQSPGEISSHPWGFNRYLERTGSTVVHSDTRELYEYTCPQEVLRAVLQASTKEQSPIQELDARYASTTYNEQHATHVRSPWAALKSLKLDFGGDTVGWKDSTWEHFQNFIKAAPNLRSLSVASEGQQYSSDSTTPGKMAEALKHSKFTSLELGPWWTTSKALLQVLAAQRHTVRQLKLYRVGLSGSGVSATESWRDILQFLGSEFELEKVDVSQIWTGKEHPQVDGGWPNLRTRQFVHKKAVDGPFVREDTMAVKGGLAEFALRGLNLEENVWQDGEWPWEDWKRAHPGHLPL
ncbi:hypothetical protein LTR17_000246 [Elasticomyces elasticus]|nr:hypothetical protein LTR17_000246 [Elasticomyces elasticus]